MTGNKTIAEHRYAFHTYAHREREIMLCRRYEILIFYLLQTDSFEGNGKNSCLNSD